LGWLFGKYRDGPLSLLMIDVDKFKLVNDTHGHASGDLALRLIAHTLRSNIRAVDCLARYGGEEFIVIMPGLEEDGSMIVAERLRRSIESVEFITIAGVQIRLTVSIGISSTSTLTASYDKLLHEADAALYSAKENGRNQIVLYRLID
jgi:two-component system cell cycle response regulator